MENAALRVFFCLFVFFLIFPLKAQNTANNAANQLRSFDEIFPGLDPEKKREIFSREGLMRTPEKNGALELVPGSASGVDLYSRIVKNKPSYLAEGLIVVPYSGRALGRLDSYNALANIRDLKGRLYHSHTRQEDHPLFEDATRIESADRHRAIPDPGPVSVLPLSDTIFVRIKDVNFGNSYFRGEMSATPQGIIYGLTNFKGLTFFIFTVVKKERFSATLYMEGLAEGMMIYVVAGADVSDFVASRVSIPSALAKRGAVFVDWVSENLNKMR